MKIKDIMTGPVETLGPRASVQEAAEKMCYIDAGMLPIVEKGCVLGVVTDRDVAVRAVAEGKDPARTETREIMTEEVVSCLEDDEVEKAARCMADNQVRRLVVLDAEGMLKGVVSLGDLATDAGDPRLTGRVLEKVSQPGIVHEHEAQPASQAAKEGAMRMEDESCKIINGLVKDELSAVETYRQALEKVGAEPAAVDLRRIESEHEEAVNMLQERVAELGDEPATSSGVWGAWAKTVEGTAKLFGNKAAIKALKEGEQHGIGDYERALRSEALDDEVKNLISTSLLPRTREHITVLNRCMREGGSTMGLGPRT